jgi:hypothetical protein
MAKPKTEVITIRIPIEIMDKIRKAAEREYRYYTTQINEILKKWVKENKAD